VQEQRATSAERDVNHGYTYIDHITKRYAGLTALRYYSSRYTHSTVEEWRGRIEQGRIQRDGISLSNDDVLKAGDVLHYERAPWCEPDAPLDFEMLDGSDDWVVINKPGGLPVLPGAGFLEHTLLHQMRTRYGKQAAPLHRLGRGTSGAILFSLCPKAAASLSAAMRERRFEKIYLAVVDGCPTEDVFTVDVPIGPLPHAGLVSVHAANPRGKHAHSVCRVLHRDRNAGRSLIEVSITTGRPHQIRIHLAAAGHPLSGDPMYIAGGLPRPPSEDGGQAVPGDCGYTLHSWKLSFPDPAGPSMIQVIATPTQELNAWLERVEKQ
jgi:23S rRNA pseudouridine1911/1915/1917 synthase